MTPALPAPIADYVEANARLDVDGMLKPFAADAVVLDNGPFIEGHAEIRALLEEAVVPVKAIFTPDTVRHENGQVVVEGPAHGDFPGSPTPLHLPVHAGERRHQGSGDHGMSVTADPTEFAGKRVLVSGGTKGAGRADRRPLPGRRRPGDHRRPWNPRSHRGVEFVQADLTTAEGGELLANDGARATGRRRHPRPRDRRIVHTGRRLRRADGRRTGSPS